MHYLTKNEIKILTAIKDFFGRENIMPTIRELKKEAENLGLVVKSPRSVLLYLRSLEEKRIISRTGKARGIRIKNELSQSFIDVPILGMANAGIPTIYAEENKLGFLKVSQSIVKKRKLFAIQVKGNSMNECQVNSKKIRNNDFVIVDPEDRSFKNKDNVLVEIDGLATIKSYKKLDKNKIGLFPMSADKIHKPIYLTPADSFMIAGKVIDVFKNIETTSQLNEVKVEPIPDERSSLLDQKEDEGHYIIE